jgi:bifunctional DNA-binding transcriptional regulator/antitoxin component of YhaV-PrlF toxin-antitoxin module
MDSTNKAEVRKVQALTGERTFIFCLPKEMATELSISKGDFLKYYLNGNRLIIEKLEL